MDGLLSSFTISVVVGAFAVLFVSASTYIALLYYKQRTDNKSARSVYKMTFVLFAIIGLTLMNIGLLGYLELRAGKTGSDSPIGIVYFFDSVKQFFESNLSVFGVVTGVGIVFYITSAYLFLKIRKHLWFD